MSRATHRLAAALLVCAVSVAGCGKSGGEPESGVGGDPASVIPVGGPGNLHSVHLSSDAAARIGLQTDTVRVEPADPKAAGVELLVPVAAVLYDQNGATWVYAQTAPRTFQRAPVVVERTTGEFAVLRPGPAAGTPVATVGAAELRGSEDGVPGE